MKEFTFVCPKRRSTEVTESANVYVTALIVLLFPDHGNKPGTAPGHGDPAQTVFPVPMFNKYAVGVKVILKAIESPPEVPT